MESSLILADIGNTNIHIYKNGDIFNIKNPQKFDKKVYYISVNKNKEKEFLKLNPNAVNLKDYVEFKSDYKNLGIDRIMACVSVQNGVVIDAGSAVTIDIMKDGIHQGGIIAPGLFAFKEAFVKISEVLKVEYKKIEMNTLPKNTNEALIYGSVGLIINTVKNFEGPYFFTGGDGEFLSKFIGGVYIKDLVFRGMIKTIKEKL